MKRSTDRIITTHVGSLPRPHDLLDVMNEKVNGRPYDAPAFETRVKSAINDVVKRQADAGIDVVGDGEQSKAGFFAYVRDRLTGFEPGEAEPFEVAMGRPREIAAFRTTTALLRAARTKRVGTSARVVCRGPISYVGTRRSGRHRQPQGCDAGPKRARGLHAVDRAARVSTNEYYSGSRLCRSRRHAMREGTPRSSSRPRGAGGRRLAD